ncbi:DUF6479 family protein [Streptomyces sp. NPDC052701]|uniref:DUF6479 family protein n=1 Tax=Streptomyces sp. NPDC052701 TaxID=3155533 RepID=UPI003441E743
MNTAWMELAAGRGALGVGLIVAGVVVVALLLGAFVLGVRVMRRESPAPRPEEQPRMPDGGPVRETQEHREADEMPKSDTRLTPHELKGHGNMGDQTSPSQERPRWNEGSSGGFGSGGSGAR